MATYAVRIGLTLTLFAVGASLFASENGQALIVQPDSAAIASACNMLKQDTRWPRGTQFVCAGPGEPSKEWHTTLPPDASPTVAITGYHASSRQVIEALVDVSHRRILSCVPVSGVKPMITGTDFTLCDSIVHADPRWLAAIAKRGITDPSTVVVDGWASGITSNASSNRIARGNSYVLTDGVNQYDRPIEGLICHVDLDARTVIDVFDRGVVPVAPVSEQHDNISISPEPLVPLTIKHDTEPFVVNDQHVQWQGWSFRFLMHPREGLVLYDVRRTIDGQDRRIAWRIGLSEMFVPYGDSASGWHWRNAFDVGEYGVGVCSWPLVVGADVPSEAHTFPIAAATSSGAASTLADVVALYERDGGMYLRHRDPNSFKVVARRGRELVITHTATVGNYDYAISYIFGLEGAIRVETRLSGILLAKGVSDTSGMIIAKNLAAPFHQHFFNFRIDLDVDGTKNTVHELDVWSPPTPTPENPRGNTIMLDNYEYRFEQEARSSVDAKKSRTWMIASTERTSFNGEPTAYMLMPGGNAFPYLDSLALPRTRARFVDHHFWATVLHENELYAAGAYPNQNRGGEGLPQYVANNESLHGEDVVLWYTMGITHITRPEDWPVMPLHTAGFTLLPMNFNK